jgi:hypothetical protein
MGGDLEQKGGDIEMQGVVPVQTDQDMSRKTGGEGDLPVATEQNLL